YRIDEQQPPIALLEAAHRHGAAAEPVHQAALKAFTQAAQNIVEHAVHPSCLSFWSLRSHNSFKKEINLFRRIMTVNGARLRQHQAVEE
ncbi:MAG TPA: hypothetical protein VN515_00750, partial [Terriglobales bacterium]|nr:hypothetical protein [Terriglobales bacterium]